MLSKLEKAPSLTTAYIVWRSRMTSIKPSATTITHKTLRIQERTKYWSRYNIDPLLEPSKRGYDLHIYRDTLRVAHLLDLHSTGKQLMRDVTCCSILKGYKKEVDVNDTPHFELTVDIALAL